MINLKKTSLKWAIESILKEADTNLFPIPFEYKAIEENCDEVIEYIRGLDVYHEGIRDYRTAITPKNRKGFRVATQLDPIDSIISLAIIYEISDDIERSRLSKSKDIVYSYRLKPENDGTLYDYDYNWTNFQEKSREIVDSKEYSHVVLTDISDFYPSIYLHDIEIVLDDILKESGRTAYGQILINYVKAMHLNQTHKGLPVCTVMVLT